MLFSEIASLRRPFGVTLAMAFWGCLAIAPWRLCECGVIALPLRRNGKGFAAQWQGDCTVVVAGWEWVASRRGVFGFFLLILFAIKNKCIIFVAEL